MVRSGLPHLFLLSLLVVACNNDTVELQEEEKETCIEGWIESDKAYGIYYQKCPQDLSNCNKTLKVFINLIGDWEDGPGLLIIRNIENGQVEEFRREQPIERYRYELRMSFDRIHNYTHEVTLELPSASCTINNEFYFYTFTFDIPCDGFEHLRFDICTE